MTVVAANQTSTGTSASHAITGNLGSLNVTVNSEDSASIWRVFVEQETAGGDWKKLEGVQVTRNNASYALLFVAKTGLNVRANTYISGTADLKIEID